MGTYNKITLPYPGTDSGNQQRRQFIADLLKVAPDTRQLWVPVLTDTTTSTSVDVNGRTITWDASIASRSRVVGSGLFVTFDGTANYGTSPDAANMSFGNGTTDEPFSIYAWINLTADVHVQTILARHDLTAAPNQNLEWSFHLDATEKLVGQVFDNSVDADTRVGRTYNTGLTPSINMLVVMTYSGAATNASVKLYLFDGTTAGAVDGTDAGLGVYVAMEDKAGLTYVGAREAAGGGATNHFNGSMGAIGVVSGRLSAAEVQIIRQLGNGYYGLTV